MNSEQISSYTACYWRTESWSNGVDFGSFFEVKTFFKKIKKGLDIPAKQLYNSHCRQDVCM